MKLLILEDANINKQLIDSVIADLGFSTFSFDSVSDVFEHICNDSTPFILISEVINSAEVHFEKMNKAIALAHFKGVIFLSKYSDEILHVVKQICSDMGLDNFYAFSLPATRQQVKEKILQIITFESNRVLQNIPSKKLEIDVIEMALANGLFEPYFQAQVCSSSEKVRGFEILSRLSIDDHIYTPDAFIDTLIEHKRITEFTFIILKKTLSLLKDYNEFAGSVSLNVDYQSLEYFDFAKEILEILNQAEFPRDRFTVELTENNPDINLSVMHNLALFRMAGCRLSIDDFGTKKSGFTELLKLPFSELKIDRSFVRDMMEFPRVYKVVKALCAVAKSLDCTIVAEGVETEAQRALLMELQVSHIQGYLYSKPQPIYEAMKLLSD